MKNSIIIAAFVFGAFVFGTNQAQAQKASPKSDQATTTVNITLADVISIDASSAANGGEVNFEYNTAEDYNNGLPAKTQESALIVTSTKNFNVTVKAGGKDFKDGGNKIPVSVLTIQATGGTMGGAKQTVVLSDKEQTLVGDADLGSELTIDFNYEIPAEKSSSSDILGKPAGTYTQTVTYTATAI